MIQLKLNNKNKKRNNFNNLKRKGNVKEVEIEIKMMIRNSYS